MREKPKMRFCSDSDGNAKVVRNQRYDCIFHSVNVFSIS